MDNQILAKLEKLNDLLSKPMDAEERSYCRSQIKAILEARYPSAHPFHANFRKIPEKDGLLTNGAEIRNKLRGLVGLMKTDLELHAIELPPSQEKGKAHENPKPAKNRQQVRIFDAHGHDEAMKQSVARFLEKLGVEVIILHEKPDGGSTIIEKFFQFSNVQFAIVLISADDSSTAGNQFRARQNVIFELGFFLGKLGRDRVLALYRPAQEIEWPSDYSGVLRKPFDDSGGWKMEIARELRKADIPISQDSLFQ